MARGPCGCSKHSALGGIQGPGWDHLTDHPKWQAQLTEHFGGSLQRPRQHAASAGWGRQEEHFLCSANIPLGGPEPGRTTKQRGPMGEHMRSCDSCCKRKPGAHAFCTCSMISSTRPAFRKQRSRGRQSSSPKPRAAPTAGGPASRGTRHANVIFARRFIAFGRRAWGTWSPLGWEGSGRAAGRGGSQGGMPWEARANERRQMGIARFFSAVLFLEDQMLVKNIDLELVDFCFFLSHFYQRCLG